MYTGYVLVDFDERMSRYNFSIDTFKNYCMLYYISRSLNNREGLFLKDDSFYYRVNINRYYRCELLIPSDDKLTNDYDSYIRFTVYEPFYDCNINHRSFPNLLTFDDGVSERIMREHHFNIYSDVFKQEVSTSYDDLEIVL